MNRFFSFATGTLLLLSAQNCADTSSKNNTSTAIEQAANTSKSAVQLPPEFNGYWYQGVAELCAYDVVQERYGELREADQVNVFVTEDLSKAKQVKLDNPEEAGEDKIPVLKLNSLRRFETGIYDYSLMQSIFTPVSGAPTLKVTSTIQDWCGQVFMQTNLVPNGYRARIFSYFESEGDQDIVLPVVLLEDELWTRLRLSPFTIPTGKIKVLPSSLYVRLRHKPMVVQEADLQIARGEKESLLILQYQSIPRSLQIQFESNFPYKILGWTEKNEDKIVSKGTLKATRRSAYWTEHSNADAPLRDSLNMGHRR